MDIASKKCKKRSQRASANRVRKRVKCRIDYISDMPDHVLHQVLYHLHPKDAARTCILSKRWRQVWNSYHTVDIDLCSFDKVKKSIKLRYKDQMINRLHDEQLLSIHKFRLCFPYSLWKWDGRISDVSDWIVSAIARNVRELEVHAKLRHPQVPRYTLPPCVMIGSSITALSLCGCRIPADSVNLPHLQKLSFKNMKVSLLQFENLISGSPMIEDLRLIEIQCSESNKLSICSLDKLRRVDVHKCIPLDSIVIEAHWLETFWYYSKKKIFCKIDLSACRALKELILEYPRMTDKMFRDQIVKFPKLEKLVLSRCNMLKNIRVSGDKLRKLVIRRCRKLEEAIITSPNITTLEYRGKMMPISFLTCLSLNEAVLTFDPSSNATSKWDVGGNDASRLYKFLDDIDRYKRLKLMTLDKQGVIIYEDIRAMVLPLRHISKPHAVRISTRFRDLLDAALKTLPIPSTLSIMSHNTSDFPEIIYEELDKQKANPECCVFFKNKCWRHYLKNISVENWIFQSSGWSKASASLEWQKTTFVLDWSK
ncbi:F-box/FBD/LRR-repeat protein At1g51370-like [Chenopodium quinoa]|uniref:F-box/FBD/LRR-repeat protein At1g51370-like n=1 Tax=Chenopodium quinoa TaxID=63459 RepID=UPI000B78F5DD|nr:F-box/FBD/LRR-repeat protein At1g51370-like [Chenopodium quinoa]XP_021749866.1 F-box/FBD/LRR-repeat protein At1g51370-like [Chenopodium quinoa]